MSEKITKAEMVDMVVQEAMDDLEAQKKSIQNELKAMKWPELTYGEVKNLFKIPSDDEKVHYEFGCGGSSHSECKVRE